MPPIPQELRGRRKVLYGCKITDVDIERYLKEEGIENVPTDVASRRRYKVALVWHIAIDLDIALMTQFHRATPGREDQEPDQDMVYWSFEVHSGRSGLARVPS